MHQDFGQMQMYVNYHDRRIKLPGENLTIEIILWTEENKAGHYSSSREPE